ncbi:MAG: Na+ efflux ABC transporter permease-like protein [Chloroflexi bacterium OLB13]|nr:MAG: Na+ efflux ABC transporter permease-like protein [Chloroflexi bacterium OLB13]
MTSIFRVMRYEMGRTLRRKGFLFSTFGLPLILFALSQFWQVLAPTPGEMIRDIQQVATQFNTDKRVAVVDLSGQLSDVTAEGVTYLASEDEAVAALNADEFDTVYVIPADFGETGIARQILPTISLEGISGEPLRSLAVLELQGELDAAVVDRIRQPSVITQINLAELERGTNGASSDLSAEDRENANFTVIYVFAMLFIITVFTGSGYLMQSVIEEKETRVIEVLITSVRASQLLAGKVLAQAVMALVQVSVWIGMGLILLVLQGDFLRQSLPFLVGIIIPVSALPILLVYFILGYFMLAAFFGMVGALSNSATEGPQLAAVIIIPVMIPLFAAPAFLSDPNGAVPVICSLFPVTALLGMPMRMLLTNVPVMEVALSIGLLAVTLMGVYWLAGRFFRVQTLLAGRLPKLREIPRLVFGRS